MSENWRDDYAIYWMELPWWYKLGSWFWYSVLRRPLPDVIVFDGHLVIRQESVNKKLLTVKRAP
jgi:hypothetical protein